MKKLVLFSLVILAINHSARAQNEHQHAFDYDVVREEAVELTTDALGQIVMTTDCTTRNMKGTRQYFRPGAFIEVTSLKSRDKVRLSLTEYLLALRGLRCSCGAVYKTVSFQFEQILPEQVELLKKGDTLWVNCPVRQHFTGRALNSKLDYKDLTIKEVVMCYFYDKKNVLTGLIDRIIVVGTYKDSKP